MSPEVEVTVSQILRFSVEHGQCQKVCNWSFQEDEGRGPSYGVCTGRVDHEGPHKAWGNACEVEGCDMENFHNGPHSRWAYVEHQGVEGASCALCGMCINESSRGSRCSKGKMRVNV